MQHSAFYFLEELSVSLQVNNISLINFGGLRSQDTESFQNAEMLKPAAKAALKTVDVDIHDLISRQNRRIDRKYNFLTLTSL